MSSLRARFLASRVARLFLSLTVVLLLAVLGSNLRGHAGAQSAGGGDEGGGGGDGGACGSQAGDADAVAATRAAADAQCDCQGARNHGRYVSCVAHVVNQEVRSGSLRAQCSGEVIGCAAQSTCGRRGFVTCCRTDASGNTQCSVKRGADKCRAPEGGSACVGTFPSCCDACSEGGCAGGTTTTTAQATTSTSAASTTGTTATSTTATTTTSTTRTTTTTSTTRTTTTTSTTRTTTTSTTATTATSTTATTTTSTTRTTTTSTTATTATSTTATTATSTTATTATTTTSTTRTTTTTTATTSTTTTMPGPLCCSPARIVTTSSPGTLTVGAFAPFPFPPNVQTIVEVGAADASCKHNGIVPAGGFTVPTFCIPALAYSSVVEAKGCESGGADGRAMVWDATAPAPDPNVTRVADTSDADGGGPSCGTLGIGCNTAPGGAAGDTKGNINTTRGGAPLASGAVHTQVDIPVVSTTWSDADGGCPDADGRFDPSRDSLITQFSFILSPTTGASSAAFTDLNGDSCSSAGAAGAANPKAGTGSPAPGPCCTVGQSTTVVATGTAFSGAFPLYDLTFSSVTPTTISSCGTPTSPQTCTLTTDPCQD